MSSIYILKLNSNKYYVGRTGNINFRLEDHFNLTGSAWTKIYHPVEIEKIIPNCDNFDEDKYTLIYMNKYGINNVRGGSFCEINLSNNQMENIQNMINGSTDKCLKCSASGHFANDCDKLNKVTMVSVKCNKCYREGHNSKECYATTYVNGKYIIPAKSRDKVKKNDYIKQKINKKTNDGVFCCSHCRKPFSTYNGAKYHENFYCSQNIRRK